MKAYAYVNRIGLDDLRMIELPDPQPGPYDILLRMRAAALNFRDLAIARGNYHIQVSAPLIPVSDGAGEVIATGPAVTRFRLGDMVCPTYLPGWIDGTITPTGARRRLGGPHDGLLSELVVINEEAAVRAPRHLAPEEAATLPISAVTAWHSLYHLGVIHPGDTVVVQGTGGVSTSAIQFASAGGARVISVVRRDRHAERLRALGAHDVIVTDATPAWPARVVTLTNNAGADVVVNVAGGVTLAQSIACTRMGGTTHLIGYASDTSAQIDIFDAIRHGAVVRVAAAGSRTSFERMVTAIEVNQIRPAISGVFPLARVHDAFAALQEGGHFGKLVLTF